MADERETRRAEFRARLEALGLDAVQAKIAHRDYFGPNLVMATEWADEKRAQQKASTEQRERELDRDVARDANRLSKIALAIAFCALAISAADAIIDHLAPLSPGSAQATAGPSRGQP